jgi:hypothetical protein
MITRAIENAFLHAKRKGWRKTYWAFDIHGTLVRPNHKKDEIATAFYHHVIEVMQIISKRQDIVRILYTCSYPHEIDQYLGYFAEHGIHFDYVNENPEVTDGGYGYYKDKFYFNVLFEDKAGFNGETDWLAVRQLLSEMNN